MWDTTEWREKTADLIKISAPIRVLQRKRTNRRCLGTDRFITQNLLRVTEAGESTSALQTGRQRPGNPMVHFQAKDSLLENFFFFFVVGNLGFLSSCDMEFRDLVELQWVRQASEGKLGFLSTRSRGIDPHLKMRWATQCSSRVVSGNSGFLSSCDR